MLGSKVEEAHRKARETLPASHRVLTGKPLQTPNDEQRDRLNDMERIVLYTLDMDVAAETPFALITAQVKKWKDGMWFAARGTERGGSATSSSAEAVALDRAANEVAVAMVGSEMCLLWTAHELAAMALWIGLAHARRLQPGRYVDAAQVEALVDRSVLRRGVEQYLALLEADVGDAEAWGSFVSQLPPLQSPLTDSEPGAQLLGQSSSSTPGISGAHDDSGKDEDNVAGNVIFRHLHRPGSGEARGTVGSNGDAIAGSSVGGNDAGSTGAPISIFTEHSSANAVKAQPLNTALDLGSIYGDLFQ